MFLIDLSFTAPLDIVDQHVAAHRQYLAGFYEQGVLLLGGRKTPRTGGLILARLGTRAEVEQLFNADPLIQAKVASYTVIEFEPVMFAKEMAHLQ